MSPSPHPDRAGGQDEVRLIAMRVAGTYGRGGLRLAVAASDHKTAWDNGITEEEAREAAARLEIDVDASINVGEYVGPVQDRLADKFRLGFPTQKDSNDE